MKLSFVKMQGCGNDYIYLDGFSQTLPESHCGLAKRLSDRHFGIGSDGLVLMLPSQTADAQMRMFNYDGSESPMCGNAIRCVAKYLFEHQIVPKNPMTIETKSGIKRITLYLRDEKVEMAQVNMGAPMLNPQEIPVLLSGERIVNQPIEVGEQTFFVTCVSMGNPHAVIFCDDPKGLDLEKIGPQIENHPLFPKRTNVEFVKILGANRLLMRVWERGAGETLACGTGACAVAVAAILNKHCDPTHPISVVLTGGTLEVGMFNGEVLMTGPCEEVFKGEILL